MSLPPVMIPAASASQSLTHQDVLQERIRNLNDQLRHAKGILSTDGKRIPRRAYSGGIPIILRNDTDNDMVTLRTKLIEQHSRECSNISAPISNIYEYFDHYDTKLQGEGPLRECLNYIARQNTVRDTRIQQFIGTWKENHFSLFDSITGDTPALFDAEERKARDEEFLKEAWEQLKALRLKMPLVAAEVNLGPSQSAGPIIRNLTDSYDSSDPSAYVTLLSMQRNPSSAPRKATSWPELEQKDMLKPNSRSAPGSRRPSAAKILFEHAGSLSSATSASLHPEVRESVAHSGNELDRSETSTSMARRPTNPYPEEFTRQTVSESTIPSQSITDASTQQMHPLSQHAADGNRSQHHRLWSLPTGVYHHGPPPTIYSGPSQQQVPTHSVVQQQIPTYYPMTNQPYAQEQTNHNSMQTEAPMQMVYFNSPGATIQQPLIMSPTTQHYPSQFVPILSPPLAGTNSAIHQGMVQMPSNYATPIASNGNGVAMLPHLNPTSGQFILVQNPPPMLDPAQAYGALPILPEFVPFNQGQQNRANDYQSTYLGQRYQKSSRKYYGDSDRRRDLDQQSWDYMKSNENFLRRNDWGYGPTSRQSSGESHSSANTVKRRNSGPGISNALHQQHQSFQLQSSKVHATGKGYYGGRNRPSGDFSRYPTRAMEESSTQRYRDADGRKLLGLIPGNTNSDEKFQTQNAVHQSQSKVGDRGSSQSGDQFETSKPRDGTKDTTFSKDWVTPLQSSAEQAGPANGLVDLCKIRVRGNFLEEEYLRPIFIKYGTMRFSTRPKRDNQRSFDNRPTSNRFYCVVQYDNVDSARRALSELNGMKSLDGTDVLRMDYVKDYNNFASSKSRQPSTSQHKAVDAQSRRIPGGTSTDTAPIVQQEPASKRMEQREGGTTSEEKKGPKSDGNPRRDKTTNTPNNIEKLGDKSRAPITPKKNKGKQPSRSVTPSVLTPKSNNEKTAISEVAPKHDPKFATCAVVKSQQEKPVVSGGVLRKIQVPTASDAGESEKGKTIVSEGVLRIILTPASSDTAKPELTKATISQGVQNAVQKSAASYIAQPESGTNSIAKDVDKTLHTAPSAIIKFESGKTATSEEVAKAIQTSATLDTPNSDTNAVKTPELVQKPRNRNEPLKRKNNTQKVPRPATLGEFIKELPERAKSRQTSAQVHAVSNGSPSKRSPRDSPSRPHVISNIAASSEKEVLNGTDATEPIRPNNQAGGGTIKNEGDQSPTPNAIDANTFPPLPTKPVDKMIEEQQKLAERPAPLVFNNGLKSNTTDERTAELQAKTLANKALPPATTSIPPSIGKAKTLNPKTSIPNIRSSNVQNTVKPTVLGPQSRPERLVTKQGEPDKIHSPRYPSLKVDTGCSSTTQKSNVVVKNDASYRPKTHIINTQPRSEPEATTGNISTLAEKSSVIGVKHQPQKDSWRVDNQQTQPSEPSQQGNSHSKQESLTIKKGSWNRGMEQKQTSSSSQQHGLHLKQNSLKITKSSLPSTQPSSPKGAVGPSHSPKSTRTEVEMDSSSKQTLNAPPPVPAIATHRKKKKRAFTPVAETFAKIGTLENDIAKHTGMKVDTNGEGEDPLPESWDMDTSDKEVQSSGPLTVKGNSNSDRTPLSTDQENPTSSARVGERGTSEGSSNFYKSSSSPATKYPSMNLAHATFEAASSNPRPPQNSFKMPKAECNDLAEIRNAFALYTMSGRPLLEPPPAPRRSFASLSESAKDADSGEVPDAPVHTPPSSSIATNDTDAAQPKSLSRGARKKAKRKAKAERELSLAANKDKSLTSLPQSSEVVRPFLNIRSKDKDASEPTRPSLLSFLDSGSTLPPQKSTIVERLLNPKPKEKEASKHISLMSFFSKGSTLPPPAVSLNTNDEAVSPSLPNKSSATADDEPQSKQMRFDLKAKVGMTAELINLLENGRSPTEAESWKPHVEKQNTKETIDKLIRLRDNSRKDDLYRNLMPGLENSQWRPNINGPRALYENFSPDSSDDTLEGNGGKLSPAEQSRIEELDDLQNAFPDIAPGSTRGLGITTSAIATDSSTTSQGLGNSTDASIAVISNTDAGLQAVSAAQRLSALHQAALQVIDPSLTETQLILHPGPGVVKEDPINPEACQEDEDTGSDPVSGFFKKLFKKNASPDTQHVIMNSYEQSNDTAQSTTKLDEGKAKVESPNELLSSDEAITATPEFQAEEETAHNYDFQHQREPTPETTGEHVAIKTLAMNAPTSTLINPTSETLSNRAESPTGPRKDSGKGMEEVLTHLPKRQEPSSVPPISREASDAPTTETIESASSSRRMSLSFHASSDDNNPPVQATPSLHRPRQDPEDWSTGIKGTTLETKSEDEVKVLNASILSEDPLVNIAAKTAKEQLYLAQAGLASSTIDLPQQPSTSQPEQSDQLQQRPVSPRKKWSEVAAGPTSPVVLPRHRRGTTQSSSEPKKEMNGHTDLDEALWRVPRGKGLFGGTGG